MNSCCSAVENRLGEEAEEAAAEEEEEVEEGTLFAGVTAGLREREVTTELGLATEDRGGVEETGTNETGVDETGAGETGTYETGADETGADAGRARKGEEEEEAVERTFLLLLLLSPVLSHNASWNASEKMLRSNKSSLVATDSRNEIAAMSFANCAARFCSSAEGSLRGLGGCLMCLAFVDDPFVVVEVLVLGTCSGEDGSCCSCLCCRKN